MNVRDYVFNIGDEVITVDGVHGKITSICDCEMCKKRGFFEPTWVEEDEEGDVWDISYYDAVEEFPTFYKIGNYRFSDFDKEAAIESIKYTEWWLGQLKKRLAFMEELEKGN